MQPAYGGTASGDAVPPFPFLPVCYVKREKNDEEKRRIPCFVIICKIKIYKMYITGSI